MDFIADLGQNNLDIHSLGHKIKPQSCFSIISAYFFFQLHLIQHA